MTLTLEELNKRIKNVQIRLETLKEVSAPLQIIENELKLLKKYQEMKKVLFN